MNLGNSFFTINIRYLLTNWVRLAKFEIYNYFRNYFFYFPIVYEFSSPIYLLPRLLDCDPLSVGNFLFSLLVRASFEQK